MCFAPWSPTPFGIGPFLEVVRVASVARVGLSAEAMAAPSTGLASLALEWRLFVAAPFCCFGPLLFGLWKVCLWACWGNLVCLDCFVVGDFEQALTCAG